MTYKKIFTQVLEPAIPSKAEQAKVKKEINAFLSLLNVQLKKSAIDAKAVLGGSSAKAVWLSGDFDVDIFVKFNAKKYKDRNISDLLEKALIHFNPERIHGSRDYFWVQNNIKFEVVPVLDIKKSSDAQNVTDFSPLHVNWVKKNSKNLTADIRLAKLFCKASKCYGAESYIKGFSGHVLDILVINYKGFLKFLRAASKWKPKTIIDINRVHKGKALLNINKSKTEGPLVIVDPVEPYRNAAAALSTANFNNFIKIAKQFLKSPSAKFFTPKEINFNKLKKQGHLFIIDIKPLKAKPDVAGAKFVCAFEYLKKKLDNFNIKNAGWQLNKNDLWFFVLKNNKLPNFYELKGPPIKMKDAVKGFKKKHKSTFKKGPRLYTKVKRPLTKANDILLEALSSDYVIPRIKSAKIKKVH